MKKNYLTAIVAIFLIISTSCKKQQEVDSTSKNFESAKIQESNSKGREVDALMERLAKKLAKNISKKQVSKELKILLQNKFDGDYDVLLSDLYSKSSNGNKIKDLIEDGENLDVSSIGEASKFLNISMPVNFDQWDEESFSPIVAVKSVYFNEKTNNQIIAFDNKGKKITLDSKISPSQPVLVIGLNERIQLNSSRNVELKDGYRNTTSTNLKVDNYEEIIPVEDGGGYGGGTSFGPGTGKYHVNHCLEYLTAINCTDISQYEGWIAGSPELRLKVHYADFNQGKIADNAAIDILLKPDRRADINNTWWSVPFDQQLWVWDYTNTGTNQLYSWYEEDESISFSPEKGVDLFNNFKVLTTLPGGYFTFAALYLSKTISIKGSTEFIGQVEVNARPNIYEYAVGTGLRFRSKTKYCTESDQDIFNYVQ